MIMKILKYFILTVLIGFFSACSVFKKGTKVDKREVGKVYNTPSGLSYVFTELGTGEKVDSGDVATVHYTGFLTDSTKFDSSKDRDQPFSFKVGGGQVIEGWDEGLTYMHIGDKATFTIPSNLAYGSQDQGVIPANSTLIFDIDLLSIKEGAKPYKIAGLDTTSYESGLKIIKVVDNAENESPKVGQTVTVDYSGYLMDGTLFDSSVDRGEPISFAVGTGKVIKGWDEAIMKLKKGEKARLIIPSTLAYGKSGAGRVIPPDATLIFDVHLIDFK